jgi:syntaxin-binding protein 5
MRIISDADFGVRLLAFRNSGNYSIFTVVQNGSSWSVKGPIKEDGGVPHPLPQGSFVLDGKTGGKCIANRSRLAASLSGSSQGDNSPGILIAVGSKAAKAVSGLTGKRLGKVEWGSKVGSILDVQLVERMGQLPLAHSL